MSEWWTYTLADLLMFSNRSYYRLIGLYNEAIWPAHVLAVGAGVVVGGCVARANPQARRIALLLLAAAWGWVGWAYHLARYADINTAGPYFAGAFALQALLLCVLGLRTDDARPWRLQRRTGQCIVGLAVIAYPLLALASGRAWGSAEVFGIVPDPTALATLGVLLAYRASWVAWLIPVAWCAASGATLMELRVDHAWLLPAFAVATAAFAAHGWHRRRRIH